MRLYAFLRAFARVILRLVFRFRLYHNGEAPLEGGAILAVNHISFWDPFFLGVSAPRRHLTFMARSSLFTKPLVGWCLKKVQAVPLDRNANDFGALRTTISLLKEGKMIGIYPQGTRCPDRSPRETSFENGAAYLAMTAGVPIIPIGVATKNYRVRWFRKVVSVVGEPIFFERSRDRSVIEKNTGVLKDAICSLCDEASEILSSGKR